MSLRRGCAMRLRVGTVQQQSLGVTNSVSSRCSVIHISRVSLSSKLAQRWTSQLQTSSMSNQKFLSFSQMSDAWKMRSVRTMATSSDSSSSKDNINESNKDKASSVNDDSSNPENDGASSTQYGNPDTDEVQRMKQSESGALSTFVVIKEKTEETISVIYIFGVIFCCFPYAIYLALKSIFSKSSPEHVKNESFDLLREDHRVARALGHDVMCKANYNHATFVDNDGCDRLQVIYEVTGSKGDARVDVEMLKEGKDWTYQYVIVSTNYSVIKVLDNRSPVYANAASL